MDQLPDVKIATGPFIECSGSTGHNVIYETQNRIQS